MSSFPLPQLLPPTPGKMWNTVNEVPQGSDARGYSMPLPPHLSTLIPPFLNPILRTTTAAMDMGRSGDHGGMPTVETRETPVGSQQLTSWEWELDHLLRHYRYGPRTNPSYTFPSPFSFDSFPVSSLEYPLDALSSTSRPPTRQRPTPRHGRRISNVRQRKFPASSVSPVVVIASGNDLAHPLVIAPSSFSTTTSLSASPVSATPHPPPPSSHSSGSFARVHHWRRRWQYQRVQQAMKQHAQHLRAALFAGIVFVPPSPMQEMPQPYQSESEDAGGLSLRGRCGSAFVTTAGTPCNGVMTSMGTTAQEGEAMFSCNGSATAPSSCFYPLTSSSVAGVYDGGHFLEPLVVVQDKGEVLVQWPPLSLLEWDKQDGMNGTGRGQEGWASSSVAGSTAVLVRPLMREVIAQRWMEHRERIHDPPHPFRNEAVRIPQCAVLYSSPLPEEELAAGGVYNSLHATDASSSPVCIPPSPPFISFRSRHPFREWQRQEAIQRAVGGTAQEALIDLQVDQRYRKPGQFLRRQHRLRQKQTP